MQLSAISLALTRLGWLSTFTPASLFTTGVNGAWYDPSDYTTLFRDAAGTLPVTAVEQPVGLMLDKSKGLVLGPELVTNGDFSTGTTGWNPSGTATPTLSVVSGELRVNIASATTQIRVVQALTLVIGKTYKVVGTTRKVVGDNTFFRITPQSDGSSSGQIAVSANTATANTEIQLIFTATAATLYLVLGVSVSGTANLDGYFDNISVRELPGNHAFNSSGNSANFPVLSCRYNVLNNTETLATQSVTTRAAKYILSFWGTGSVALSGTYTGTLAGTGADNRVYVEFTATAGTLTLTVTGSVLKAQLEEL